MPVRFLAVLLLLTLTATSQVPPFHAPAQTSGTMTVKLHPMEIVAPGTQRLVTFGVPFTRGSLTAANLTTVRVLHNGVEVPAFVEQLTPWRHLANATVDGQSVRVARIQIRHSFSVSYPASETITVEWGGTARTQNVLTLTDPLSGWHMVNSGSFVAEDGIQEPDVYALLPKQALAQGVLSLRRSEPFADHIPETRDDPAVMDGIEHWPGYEEADRAFKNNFYTMVNQDDPLVTGYESGQLIDYKNDSEPWLYDRASAFFLLYTKTGFLRPLREAVRATQFYRSRLFGTAVADPYRGIFKLKAPTLAQVTAGNTTMYSYAECLAYDHWLTGNPQDVEPVRWVAATHEGLTETTRWSHAVGEWTERHTAFRTLANLVAFELTGEGVYRNNALAQMADFIWHQNGAGGLVPANRLDGGLYHRGNQHGDGVFTDLIASPWMTALLMDAMLRAYALSEAPEVAQFILRAAKFQSAATHYDDNHDYEYSGALRYPWYLARYDGVPDALDGYDTSTIEHSKETVTTIAWGNYFQHLLHGVPNPQMEANARELYLSYDIGVNHWTRPAAPPLGLTAFRSIPPRKFAWENRPSASLTWVMSLIDTISPPPVVVITSPTVSQQFTAPANILIEATATSSNSSIVKVEFFDGATKIGEDTTAPYSLQWNGIIAALPNHVLTAKATTSLDVLGSSEAVVLDMRSPTHPQLTITSPAPGTVFTAPADVVITANAVPEGASTITRVLVTQSYQFVGEDTTAPYSIPLTGLLHDTHGYEVWAWDNNGGYTVQMLDVNVQSPTPPSVTLTAPTTGAITAKGAILHFAATASAPGSAITEVVFFAGNTPIGEDTTAPYEFNWHISSRWAAGNHTVSARAYETNGGSSISSANIELVDMPPMTAQFDSPAQNTHFAYPAPIEMQASATAPGSSITRIDFYANNQFVSSDSEAPYTATFIPTSQRQWELRADAVDALGRILEAKRLVHVTGAATPVSTVSSPAAGAILVSPATPTLIADASVNFATITRVRFYDGDTLLGEDTEAPFSITSPELAPGDHKLYAIATASTGQTNSQDPVATIITVGAPNSPVAVITSPRYPGTQQAPSFSTVRFAASATHTGGLAIQRVEFWLDSHLVATDTTAPYEMDWTVGDDYGNHHLIARVHDVNGVFTNSTMVDFDLVIPPTIKITSPSELANIVIGTPTEITTLVTAGNNPLDLVRFYVNDQLVSTDTTAPYSFTWTPTTPGQHQISAYVIDERYADEETPHLKVTAVYSALQSWRITHFGSHLGTGDAADNADADHDSYGNLMEWFMGRNPVINESISAPQVTVDDFEISVTLSRSDSAEAAGVFTLEWSTDLLNWHPVLLPAASGVAEDGVSITVQENSTANDSIVVHIPRANAPSGRLMARLRATMP